MPNHVISIIKMEGIKDLPLFEIEDGEMRFDFNKLIPMPESLNLDSGSIEEIAIEAALRNDFRVSKMSDDVFADDIKRSRKTEEVLIKLGRQYISNKSLYGATTWYDWRRSNWGTKWNAYDCVLDNEDDNTIMFQTAWSKPTPIIEKLAELYPNKKIEHWWADEDMGSNSGYCCYENGEVTGGFDVTKSNEAYKHYIMCWGESNCLYQDEDNNWKMHDCDNCSLCD